MSSTLITWLKANPNCFKADCFVIYLPTGDTLTATEGQWDLTIPAGTSGFPGDITTFSAKQWGCWKRGDITSEATFSLATNTMDLTCTVTQVIVYPGKTCGLLNAAANGLFDGATLAIYTVYMTSYGTIPAGGIEPKWTGTIGSFKELSRQHVVFECVDPLYICNRKVPTRLYQPSCPWIFCGTDGNCGLDPLNYTVNFTAASGSTQTVLKPASAFTQAVGWFVQGTVKCTQGANSGLSTNVTSDAGGNLALDPPFIFPVTVGDTFSALAGCDKALPSCKTRKTAAGGSVDNSLQYGGFDFMPPPASVLGGA
jgi:uncharacterized phage protein (TIGR02218 family)